MGDKKKDNQVPPSLDCDKLNDYFANIGIEVHKNLPTPGPLIWKQPECIYSFEFRRIEVSSVLNHLLKLSNESHLDVLDFDSKLLKIAARVIAPSLTQLMNLSTETGVIISDLKIARVTPVYKGKGSKWEESNFRPISVLPMIAMILEKEIQIQVLNYFIKNDLICIDQFAFLKNHSSVLCLHRLIDDWLEAINNGEFIMSCFIDVKKCFDTIDHSILLQKLKLYGINGIEHDWFVNYLMNRKQCVHANGFTSNLTDISTVCLRDLLWAHYYSSYLSMICRNIYEMPHATCLLMTIPSMLRDHHITKLNINSNIQLMTQVHGTKTITCL